jgi:hypothetical protein
MTASHSFDQPDERLLEEALVTIRDARERLPRDFLIAIAVVLGLVAAALLAVGMLVTGRVGDLAINLSVELIGALVTVVVIDGLWSRAQSGSADRLRLIEDQLRLRMRSRIGGVPLSAEERDGWQDVVTDYNELTARATLRDRLSATRDYGRRAQSIERRAERLLGLDSPADTRSSGWPIE